MPGSSFLIRSIMFTVFTVPPPCLESTTEKNSNRDWKNQKSFSFPLLDFEHLNNQVTFHYCETVPQTHGDLLVSPQLCIEFYGVTYQNKDHRVVGRIENRNPSFGYLISQVWQQSPDLASDPTVFHRQDDESRLSRSCRLVKHVPPSRTDSLWRESLSPICRAAGWCQMTDWRQRFPPSRTDSLWRGSLSPICHFAPNRRTIRLF